MRDDIAKPFSECTNEEKIERLQQVVTQQQHFVRTLQNQVRDLEILKSHQHGSNGEVLVKVYSQGLGQSLVSGGQLSTFNPLA